MSDVQHMERVEQIRHALEERDSEDLLEIWRKNDLDEWTPEAMEAIQEILTERNGSVPEQASRLPHAEEQDAYHDNERLITIAVRAKSLSWLFVVLFGLLVVVGLIFLGLMLSTPTNSTTGVVLITWLAWLFGSALLCGFFWVVLQALAEGIYLLMDIEENTRK